VGDVWLATGVIAGATMLFRGMGPVVLGGRKLPVRAMSVIELLAPALLAALVVTQLVGGDRRLVMDARLIGLAAASVALTRKAPILAVLVVAAASTALWRLAGG
jgi:branched chain amino acid efflux pump